MELNLCGFRRKTLSTVGRVDKYRPTSVAASIDRKMYWRFKKARGGFDNEEIVLFPKRVLGT